MHLAIDPDPDGLEQARLRVLQEDTSMNVVLQLCLENNTGLKQVRQAVIADVFELSRRARAGCGTKRWTCDE